MYLRSEGPKQTDSNANLLEEENYVQNENKRHTTLFDRARKGVKFEISSAWHLMTI